MESAPVQKYMKVKKTIESMIECGELLPGGRLPSIREMSDRTGYNSSTIIRAYNKLWEEGKVYPVSKSGYYVMDMKPKKTEDAHVIDFSKPSPWKELLPYRDFLSCINKAAEIYGDEMFGYNDRKGLYGLRKELSKNLMTQQVFVKPDDIFVTSGSQQALDILARMEFPNRRDTILIEQPSYAGIYGVIKGCGIKAMGIERKKEGIDLERLENIFINARIKFFYTIPRFSNPMGFSYDMKLKKEIAKLAQKYDVYIVEDDYLADIDNDTKNDPIYALSDREHVIYLKSFSKTFLPGIRIGLAVLPDSLKEVFTLIKNASDLGTNVISQGALEVYLKSGMFENHRRNMKEYYCRKMKYAIECMDEYLPQNCSFSRPHTGFFNSIKLPENAADQDIAESLKQKGVIVTPANYFYLPEFRNRSHIRLCISSVSDEDLKRGMEIIGNTITDRNIPAKAYDYIL